MVAIERYFPDWRSLIIHESSPANRGASKRLAQDCPRYVLSQFFPGIEPGSHLGDVRCENLEALTFPDASVDLHVTQDVLEHVYHPSKVFREIARSFDGLSLLTSGVVKIWARMGEDGQISHLEPPVYHGNPISDKGSLVTVDWGYDICQAIFESCGLFTHLVYIDDLSMGIRAEYIEVLVTLNPGRAAPADTIP